MGNLLSANGAGFWIVYILLFVAIIYFFSYKPQKKARKEHDELMSKMAIGDSVKTTSGFYGVVIDMTDDTVIVEFGNNKNCRIPMQKASIVQVEKPEQAKPVEEQKNEIQK